MIQDKKYGNKVNDWLLDDEYLLNSGISSDNIDHFIGTCKRLYTTIASLPSPVYTTWNRNDQTFYFSIGINYALLPYSPDINEYDISEILNLWAYKFYPGYTIETDDEREFTPEEIASLIQEGEDPDTVFNMKCKYKKTIDFKVEKIVIRDDQLTVDINGVKYILLARPDMPISRFISNLRKFKSDIEKKDYVDKYTKSILEVTYYKSIDIKYSSPSLENFFKVRTASLWNKPIKMIDDSLMCKWDRFFIYFSNEEQMKRCLKIVDNAKKEYGKFKDTHNYLRKELNMIIGKSKRSN